MVREKPHIGDHVDAEVQKVGAVCHAANTHIREARATSLLIARKYADTNKEWPCWISSR